MTKPGKTFCSKPPIQIEGSWMLGLISLELHDVIFNIIEEKN